MPHIGSESLFLQRTLPRNQLLTIKLAELDVANEW